MQFAVGDFVWLRGKNIRTRRNRKLEWKQFEPFEVVDKLGTGTIPNQADDGKYGLYYHVD